MDNCDNIQHQTVLIVLPLSGTHHSSDVIYWAWRVYSANKHHMMVDKAEDQPAWHRVPDTSQTHHSARNQARGFCAYTHLSETVVRHGMSQCTIRPTHWQSLLLHVQLAITRSLPTDKLLTSDKLRFITKVKCSDHTWYHEGHPVKAIPAWSNFQLGKPKHSVNSKEYLTPCRHRQQASQNRQVYWLSVTYGQCDARLTVTVTVGTKLYCLTTKTHVWTTCPKSYVKWYECSTS